jgi:hypothetical protein
MTGTRKTAMRTRDERSQPGPARATLATAALAAAFQIAACCSTPCANQPDCHEPPDGGPDVSQPCSADTILSGALDGCGAAQLVCALSSDVTSAAQSPDFVPQATHTASFEARVAVWQRILDRLEQLSPSDDLKVAIVGLRGKLMLVQADEDSRRGVTESGYLSRAAADLRTAGGGACGPG